MVHLFYPSLREAFVPKGLHYTHIGRAKPAVYYVYYVYIVFFSTARTVGRRLLFFNVDEHNRCSRKKREAEIGLDFVEPHSRITQPNFGYARVHQ